LKFATPFRYATFFNLHSLFYVFPLGLTVTTVALWVGALIAAAHYAVRKNWVELFGTGVALLVVGPTLQALGQGYVALTGVILGHIGISYLVIAAIVAILLAVKHGVKVFVHRIMAETETTETAA
jgi:hypothetical protein